MRSGTPRSCEGPRRYAFYGGAATWLGCPRLSIGSREGAWIAWHDRSDGRLSATELLTVPMILVDAFDVLDELRAQAVQHERAQQEARDPRRR